MAITTLNLKVTLNKPGTFNVPIKVIMKELNSNFGLNLEHVEALYNLEIPNCWYLTLTEEAKAEHHAR